MAKTKDLSELSELSELSDQEFMDAWDAAGERAAAAKKECKTYGVEHQRRLAAAEDERVAAKVPSELDQVVGKVAE